MDAQKWIHRMELGGGAKFFRLGLGLLAVLVLAVIYDVRCFRNFSTIEAMDSAQLARNLARGKGYTTDFIRPLSMRLQREVNETREGLGRPGALPDHSRLRQPHPDISNPPAYPVLLAGVMKVLPFRFQLTDKPMRFWSPGGRFVRYQPDFLIAVFNQFLLFVTLVLVYFLARRLLGGLVAGVSLLLLLGNELLWRFSVSGLSTTWLTLIFVGLAWCLVLLESESREPRRKPASVYGLAAAAGLLTGLGTLTRYSFGWFIIPVVAFIVLLPLQRKSALGVLAAAAFILALGPWVIRNYSVSGASFGTATYAAVEGTYAAPGTKLQRSFEPILSRVPPSAFWHKLNQNLRQITQTDLPGLAGGWLSAFFLVGLMVALRNPAARRLRYFLLGGLALACLVQALGRTYLSDDSPGINSENMLVLFAPFVVIYGVSLFFQLLDQIVFPARELRFAAIGLFAAVACLPMILFLLPPRNSPIVFPYLPNYISGAASFTRPDELMMSDVPWAVAWYGNRQCVWLNIRGKPDLAAPTLEAIRASAAETVRNADFYRINDNQKAIQALLISRVTLGPGTVGLPDWLGGGEDNWGDFMVLCGINNSNQRPIAPPGFPLTYLQRGWPTQFLLTARPRPVDD